MTFRTYLSLLLCLIGFLANSQTLTVKGRVTDALTNVAIPFATVQLQGAGAGALSNDSGYYEIQHLKPGVYNFEASAIGYAKKFQNEIQVSSSAANVIDFALDEEASKLKTVNVVASAFTKTAESPVAVRTIGATEIKRNPGGNRDISKVIQSLPGVASGVSFRNDIIVRGGSTSENRFYVDGFEVPNINHFATQGASGGPVGLLNVNFIREVDFYSGAFPASRGNALSSVMSIKQIDGRTDRLGGSLTLGSSDLGVTLEGPVGSRSSFIASYRKSYLEYLFRSLALPFLPAYQDAEIKHKFRMNDKNEFTFLFLGAIDDFTLNTDANETEDQRYILGNLPVNTQWNYTIGGQWKHFDDFGYYQMVLSRNMLNNEAVKYFNNIEEPQNLILKYASQESENKLRLERVFQMGPYKASFGASAEQDLYTNSTYNKLPVGLVDFNSRLSFIRYGAFAQLNREIGSRLLLSGAFRMDGSTYSDYLKNPLRQFSPRLSLSYAISPKLSFNANTGIYYQLPAYTVLGYRNNLGELVNQNVKAIRCTHYVAGLEYNSSNSLRFTVEGFLKRYANYPFLTREGVSLANLGADFGVVGNAPVVSNGNGRAYGVEFLAQKKLSKHFFGIMAYTFVRSEFTNAAGEYVPSAWDNRHLLSLTGGVQFGKNWELGVKFRYGGGAPYTPYDLTASSLKSNYDITGKGIADYSKLNSLRLNSFNAMDVRLDKKYNLKRLSLDFYFDIQNVYNSVVYGQPFLTVQRDANGNPVTDPANSNAYSLKELANISGTVLPSIGVIVEF